MVITSIYENIRDKFNAAISAAIKLHPKLKADIKFIKIILTDDKNNKSTLFSFDSKTIYFDINVAKELTVEDFVSEILLFMQLDKLDCI